MTSRREFLQIGIAATTLPLAARAASAASFGLGEEQAGALPLYKALYDVRFDESVAFSRRLEQRGIRVHAFAGDVTRFWYEELYHVWRAGPAAVAGLTAHGPLFCLERLAWDQGMRVVFRAEHRFGHGRIDHLLSGPSSMLDAFDAGGDPWSCVADVVASCPSGRAEIAQERRAAPYPGAAREDALYSWVIAPAKRA